jgi:uncharacterized membrane protein YqjE
LGVDDQEPGSSPSGLDALRALGANAISLARIRLELLSLEVAEERERWARMIFWGALSALLIAQALFFAAAAAALWWWDQDRQTGFVIGAATLTMVSLVCIGRWRACLKDSPPAGASLSELRQDEAALRPPR